MKLVNAMVSALGMATLATSSMAAQYQPGEVIVKYRTQSVRTLSTMNQLYDRLGVQGVEHFDSSANQVEKLILKDGASVEETVASLQSNPLVEYAQPNYILSVPENARFNEMIAKLETAKLNLQAHPAQDPPACILPGLPFPPGCKDDGGGGGGGGGGSCIAPGIPFPPGCDDGGGGGGGGGGGSEPTTPLPAGCSEISVNPLTGEPDWKAPAVRPAVADAPADATAAPDKCIDGAWGLATISAKDAWTINPGSRSVIVADIDTGIDYNHEDLSANLWRNAKPSAKKDVVGYDFVHDDGLPFDDGGHGTHTAGTIGATGNNGVGVSGVAQKVSIMALKFIGGNGQGTTADAVKAIDYGIAHGAKVMSNSWGSEPGPNGETDPDNKVLFDAIDRAQSAGVLFVVAAGNSSNNNDDPAKASTPASFTNDNLVAVAATSPTDSLAFFSNYGLKTTHLGAPGTRVYSTFPDSQYARFDGTSMACPHVAGAAALILAQHPTWDYKQVKKALLDSVDVIPALQGKTVTGGRLNLAKALRATERRPRH